MVWIFMLEELIWRKKVTNAMKAVSPQWLHHNSGDTVKERMTQASQPLSFLSNCVATVPFQSVDWLVTGGKAIVLRSRNSNALTTVYQKRWTAVGNPFYRSTPIPSKFLWLFSRKFKFVSCSTEKQRQCYTHCSATIKFFTKAIIITSLHV